MALRGLLDDEDIVSRGNFSTVDNFVQIKSINIHCEVSVFIHIKIYTRFS